MCFVKLLLNPNATTDKCVSSNYFLAGAYQWLLAVNTTFCLWPQALHLVSLFLTLFLFTNKTATHNNYYIYMTYIYTFMLIFFFTINTLNKRYKESYRKEH